MILAGDIGGTKTVLALYQKQTDGGLQCLREQTFASQEFTQFDAVLSAFLPSATALESACFGIAGPVVNQRCQTTNLPWLVDAEPLKQRLGIARVQLLNDLEATALGMLALPAPDLVELNPNARTQVGNIAVIAAGTGLGEAILHWDGQQHLPVATEGGHCDFAPQSPQQDGLLAYLRKHFPAHVSYERILSGPGFGHLYDFLRDSQFAPPCPAVFDTHERDRNAVISRLGLNDEDALCTEAVRMFVEIYGAEAGNLALKSLAVGGVFIGGGIGPKIRPKLESGIFMQAFKNKGRFLPLLDTVSVKLSLNPHTPLIGASRFFAGTQHKFLGGGQVRTG